MDDGIDLEINYPEERIYFLDFCEFLLTRYSKEKEDALLHNKGIICYPLGACLGIGITKSGKLYLVEPPSEKRSRIKILGHLFMKPQGEQHSNIGRLADIYISKLK